MLVQVFVALLRTCQPDSRRALVRQALDVLTPALVRRLSSGDSKKPMWVRYVRKILMEEGHSMAHMVHIWQLLVRHADLFYTSRSVLESPSERALVAENCRKIRPPHPWFHTSRSALDSPSEKLRGRQLP